MTVRAEPGVDRRIYLKRVGLACTGTVIKQELARRRFEDALDSGLSERETRIRTIRYLRRLERLVAVEIDKLAAIPAPPRLVDTAQRYADARARELGATHRLARDPEDERLFDAWEQAKRGVSRAATALGIECPDVDRR